MIALRRDHCRRSSPEGDGRTGRPFGIFALLALILGLVYASSSMAQTGERFAIWKDHELPTQLPPSVYELDTHGVIRSTIVTFHPNTHVEVLGIQRDNRTLLLTGYTRVSTQFTMFLADLRSDGTCTTLYQGSPLYSVLGAAPNSDGDTYLLNLPATLPPALGVYRLRGSTLTLSCKSTISISLSRGVRRDPETGDILLKGRIFNPLQKDGYFRIDPRTGAVTSFAIIDPVAFPIFDCRDTVYEYPSGSCIDVIGDATTFAQTVRTTPGQGTITLSRKWWGHVGTGLVRASQRTKGVAFYLVAQAARFHCLTPIGPDGRFGKSRYLQSAPRINYTGLVRLGSRNLSWRMVTPPNGRALDLSFPGENGRAYAVLLSASGIRPGIPLPDGRRIPIHPDSLTTLSVLGGTPGVLWPTIGRLDASGRAVVTVDTNRFGAALKGTKLWVAVLVFDAVSSNGVAWIAGPELLEIHQ